MKSAAGAAYQNVVGLNSICILHINFKPFTVLALTEKKIGSAMFHYFTFIREAWLLALLLISLPG